MYMADPITRLFSLGSKLKNLPEHKVKQLVVTDIMTGLNLPLSAVLL